MELTAEVEVEEAELERLLEFWLEQGFAYRLRSNAFMQADEQKYRDRIEMEYSVIRRIPGFIDYFLMVSDLVRWAKDQGILVGPGRGSAAGALLCYLLRITEIDPLQYPMLFERFISADRPDLPDVDIDFEDERRGEVIQYAQEKYGYNKVANILNFVRYKGPNSLKDIGTVYRMDRWKIEAIKDKLVERAEGHPRFSDTLEDTYEQYDEIAAMVQENPELKLATKLEGNYRHSSIHPCGLIIAGVDLDEIAATYEKQSGDDRGSGVAYDKKDSEYLGLLKIDFLSLTTLTGIRASLDAIGMSIAEFYEIPLGDPKVYEAFRKCDVLGIFQFEGLATRRVLQQVAPTKFMDLVDVNALSRPGGDDKAYIKAKNTGKLPDMNPAAAQHVTWTHGTIVYQEQILLILRDYGNFPVKDVNAVRKIISDKKDQTVLNEYFERFAEGAAKHGDTREQAETIWRAILSATGYAFNISHAVCYSDTAYRQMWLKIYHPEFYLGQLQKCPDDDKGKERRRKLISEAERHGIKVNPPELDPSGRFWGLEEGQLFAGFQAIKGIGDSTGSAIVKYRDQRLAEHVGYSEIDPRLLKGIRYPEMRWSELVAVPGIGPGRIETIENFCYSEDPFEVGKVKRLLDRTRGEFAAGEFDGVPFPTHTSLDLTVIDELVVFLGFPKERKYYDIVEQRLKYGSKDLTRESIIDSLDSPHLLKYASLICEDEFDEPVRVRVSRKLYPTYERMVAAAQLNRDLVLVKGYVGDPEFGGVAIQVKEMMLIQPEVEEDK